MVLKPRTESFRLSFGARGEMIAWGYLQRNGYRILEKNFRCPLGELDVVAEKNGRLVFVEIKTRRHEMFGRPEEAVHENKQRKLVRLAQWYLKAKRLESRAVSFAVLAILWRPDSEPEIRLIEDAFEASSQEND